ncbi:MAG: chemotaxis protein CheW [Bacteroidota bacterium]
MERTMTTTDLGLEKGSRLKEDTKEISQLIVFKLGGEEFAIRIDQLKEVVITPSFIKIPQTEEYILGAANIRGTVVTLFDMEKKFNLGTRGMDDTHSNYTLVIESENFKAGILVQEVPNTLSIATDAIDRSSGIVQYSSIDNDCMEGIVKSGDRLIVLIDLINLLKTEKTCVDLVD